MTFDEWRKQNPPTGDPEGIAKAAWDAAKEDAHQSVIEQARRYTCKKMRSVAATLADLIMRSG